MICRTSEQHVYDTKRLLKSIQQGNGAGNIDLIHTSCLCGSYFPNFSPFVSSTEFNFVVVSFLDLLLLIQSTYIFE